MSAVGDVSPQGDMDASSIFAPVHYYKSVSLRSTHKSKPIKTREVGSDGGACCSIAHYRSPERYSEIINHKKAQSAKERETHTLGRVHSLKRERCRGRKLVAQAKKISLGRREILADESAF
jgi:hypothetical protein